MLQILLDIFGDCSNFNDLTKQQKQIRWGYHGVHNGRKALILDDMCILDEVWIPTNAASYSTTLYSKRGSVILCWRKAAILPPNLHAEQ